MRDSSHSTASIEKPAIVAASGCAPPMPPSPAVRIQRPRGVTLEMRARAGAEGLVGALHDALRADVDPRARRHLPVHHEALAVELVEVLPGRPVRHEVRVRDQHARRIHVRAEDADRLARLHQQRLVVLQPLQHGQNGVEGFPVARGLADAAVDDQLVRMLRDLGIEVVLQHPERRLGQPAAAIQGLAAWRAHDARTCALEGGFGVHGLRG